MSRDFESQTNLKRLKAFCINGKYTAQQIKDHLKDYPDNVIDDFAEAHLTEGDDDVLKITAVEPYETQA